MSVNPQFDTIGRQFVDHFYKTFDANRSQLSGLYGANSMMTFENDQFQGAENIVKKLTTLGFQSVQHQLTTIDCQPNPSNSGVLVLVTGKLVVDGGSNPLMFTECFHLAPCATGFYVLNDIFKLNYA